MVPPPIVRARHPLAALRAELGLSATEYLRVLDARRRELGLGGMAIRREKVARWESGRAEPELATQLAMADLHGVPRARVHRLGWPGWLSHAGLGLDTVLSAPWTAAGAVEALTAVVHGDPAGRLDRRTLARVVDDTAAAEPDAFCSFGAGRPWLSGRLLVSLERRLADLRWLQMTQRASQVLPIAVADLGALERLATTARFDAHAGHRLLRLVAGTALIRGWAEPSRAEPSRAEPSQAALVVALRAAACTGDAEVVEHAYGYLMLGAYAVDGPEAALSVIASSYGVPTGRDRTLPLGA